MTKKINIVRELLYGKNFTPPPLTPLEKTKSNGDLSSDEKRRVFGWSESLGITDRVNDEERKRGGMNEIEKPSEKNDEKQKF